eukprot:XP_011679481.1 PREDICTED: uncharacterized protein LOC105445526 [Strongylocentrotus purpuratus]
MTCYVKNTVIGGPTDVSFDRLKSGTRICEPFELDFPNQSDSVAVSLKVGQNNKLEVNLLFRLEDRRQGPSSQDKGVPRNNPGITEATQGDTDFTSLRPSTSTFVVIPPEGAAAAVDGFSTSTASEVSDGMLNRLARRIPSHNYDTLSERLNIEHTEARNILESTFAYLTENAGFSQVATQSKHYPVSYREHKTLSTTVCPNALAPGPTAGSPHHEHDNDNESPAK